MTKKRAFVALKQRTPANVCSSMSPHNQLALQVFAWRAAGAAVPRAFCQGELAKVGNSSIVCQHNLQKPGQCRRTLYRDEQLTSENHGCMLHAPVWHMAVANGELRDGSGPSVKLTQIWDHIQDIGVKMNDPGQTQITSCRRSRYGDAHSKALES